MVELETTAENSHPLAYSGTALAPSQEMLGYTDPISVQRNS